MLKAFVGFARIAHFSIMFGSMGGEEDFELMNRALHADLALPGSSQEADPCEGELLQAEGVAWLQDDSASLKHLLEVVGEEKSDAKLEVYLGTSSHLLPETLAVGDLIDVSTLSREQICNMVWDAFENPEVNVSAFSNIIGALGQLGSGFENSSGVIINAGCIGSGISGNSELRARVCDHHCRLHWQRHFRKQ